METKYHTFNELYEFRKVFNAALFNEWASSNKYSVHKSKKHSDGELCFGGGWFIVVAILPSGQISNHYEMKDWGLFQIPEKETASTFDGHKPADVLSRMQTLVATTSTDSKMMSFGELLVGLKFNPSNDDKVSKAKKLFADIADLVNDECGTEIMLNTPRPHTMNNNFAVVPKILFDHTIGEILNAQMNVVKLLTLKY